MSTKMILYDGLAAHTYLVRLFILERGGIQLDVKQLDIMSLENRGHEYCTQVNSRGEVPALQISKTFVLTEVTAICEYLDEVATGGTSLYGTTPLERAETRMWTRRMDLEIAQPVISWFRDDPASIDFYRGHRIPSPEARMNTKLGVNRALNRLDEELKDKQWLCGARFSAADVHFYGLLKMMFNVVPWVSLPARKNVAAYFARMAARPTVKAALDSNWYEHMKS